VSVSSWHSQTHTHILTHLRTPYKHTHACKQTHSHSHLHMHLHTCVQVVEGPLLLGGGRPGPFIQATNQTSTSSHQSIADESNKAMGANGCSDVPKRGSENISGVEGGRGMPAGNVSNRPEEGGCALT